ncbi:MAG: hypothetical protein Q4D07_06950 [Selenomonadaceae bacterium]|nr:hypothetical protein [Selenomonadaceae bacterium]
MEERLELLRQIREAIVPLKANYQHTAGLLKSLSDLIENDSMFLDSAMVSDLREDLHNIEELETKIQTAYERLPYGRNLPATVGELTFVINREETRLNRAMKTNSLRDFIKGMRFYDESLNSRIQSKCSAFYKFKPSNSTDDEFEAIYAKYNLLREACTASDTERMQLCIDMREEMGIDIITAIMLGNLTFPGKESAERVEAEQSAENEVSGKFAVGDDEINAIQKAEEISAYVQAQKPEPASELNETAEDIQITAESTEETIVQGITDEPVENNEVAIPDGYVQPDSDALRELKCEVRFETNGDKSEEKVTAKWFSSAILKSKMTPADITVLTHVAEVRCCTHDRWQTMETALKENGLPLFDAGRGIERLWNNGFLCKCIVDGVGEYYRLTTRAVSLYEYDRNIEKLSADKKEYKRLVKFYKECNPIMGLFLAKGFCVDIYMDIDNDETDYQIGDKTAIAKFIKGSGEDLREVLVFCINSDNPEDFLKMRKALEGEYPNWSCAIAVGIDRNHAKAIAEWTRKNFEDRQEVTFGYISLDCDEVRDIEDDSVIKEYSLAVEPTDVLEPDTDEDATTNSKDDINEPKPDFGSAADTETVISYESAAGKEETDAFAADTDAEEASVVWDELSGDGLAVEEQSRPVDLVSTECAGESVAEETEEDIESVANEMLAGNMFSCAMAYYNAASEMDSKYGESRLQLAYALNDPAAKCEYAAGTIISVFMNGGAGFCNKYWYIAAVMRCLFYNHRAYDYDINSMLGTIEKDEMLNSHPEWSQIIYELRKFRNETGYGIDKVADYHSKGAAEVENGLKAVKEKAKNIHGKYVAGGPASMKWFSERHQKTYEYIFGTSELSDLIDYVANQPVESDYIELVGSYLKEHYLKEDQDISIASIDTHKISDEIDEAWDASKQLVTNKSLCDNNRLTGKYRNSLDHLLQDIAEIFCNYVIYGEQHLGNNFAEKPEYKKTKGILLGLIREAEKYSKCLPKRTPREEVAGLAVINAALDDMKKRLNGTYSENDYRFFYANFLTSDKVMLDSRFLPVLLNVDGIKKASAMSRIRSHSRISTAKSYEKRLEEVYNEDNYGLADLLLDYLETKSPGIRERHIQEHGYNECKAAALELFEDKFRHFVGDLELRQSYGQVDTARKEEILLNANKYYESAKDTGNFGFYENILNEYIKMIAKEAETRGESVKQRLADCEGRIAGSTDENAEACLEIVRKRIADKNYTAAEDMLGRLEKGEPFSEGDVYDNAELSKFISSIQDLYFKVSDFNKSLQSVVYATGAKNKDARGADALLKAWPQGDAAVNANRLKALLEALGFRVKDIIERQRLGKHRNYDVTLEKPDNGHRDQAAHPAAAFGSAAESKCFRVVTIFGKYDADQIMNLIGDVGTANNTIIIADNAINLVERRKLARLIKNKGGNKTFLVIDRVMVAYLIRNYKITTINHMLMNIALPWAYCQPYVYNSVQVIPPEMFIGRSKEIDDIEAPNGVNILYGGRQLGKSAMLQKAKDNINNDGNGKKAVLVDIKEKEFAQAAEKISRELIREGVLGRDKETDNWDKLGEDIKDVLLNENSKFSYLLLLLDEADVFIDSCKSKEVNYHPFDVLKDIQRSCEGKFKFVVAGLRDVIRFAQESALSNNSVLTQLKSTVVKPFNSAEARELLLMPLSCLGFIFENDEKTESMIASIFSHTNYFPGLIQLYCAKLIESMQAGYAVYDQSTTPPYIVTEKHIQDILAEKELQTQIKEKFEITLNVGDDNYYKLIALIMAAKYHEGTSNACSADDIHLWAGEYGIRKLFELDVRQVGALMEEMQELNVLQNDGNGGYRFAHMSFLQMVGDGKLEKIEEELLKLMEV